MFAFALLFQLVVLDKFSVLAYVRFYEVAFLVPRCSCADCREIITKDIGWKRLCECRTKPKMHFFVRFLPSHVVNGSNLVGDPVLLPHVCLPKKNAQERVERVVYKKACQLNLSALVADGVHDLQPDATNKTGQLYVIHGVMADSVDVPLLFAITKRKSQRVYDVIYGRLRDAIAAAAGPQRLRILLDYEKAAISAARRLMGVRLGVKYPRMSDLLFALRGCVTTAKGALLNMESVGVHYLLQ
uniref:MULE transposase domain-containing protein n=1 Tax=Haemonchus contortus TaxID=6289 RepID=W6NHY1_HAECO